MHTNVQADILDAQSCARLVREALKTFGQIDILVDSANMPVVLKPFAAMTTWEEFALAVTGELKGAFEITKAVVPIMQQQHYGRLVYLGSGTATLPMEPALISVGVAKAGIVTFARYLAREYGPDGITVNVVSPGMVNTDWLKAAPQQERQATMAAMTPLRRIAQPEDIARAIAFFAGDDSRFVTGITTQVNGGVLMD